VLGFFGKISAIQDFRSDRASLAWTMINRQCDIVSWLFWQGSMLNEGPFFCATRSRSGFVLKCRFLNDHNAEYGVSALIFLNPHRLSSGIFLVPAIPE
jgi:hypothetical protein